MKVDCEQLYIEQLRFIQQDVGEALEDFALMRKRLRCIKKHISIIENEIGYFEKYQAELDTERSHKPTPRMAQACPSNRQTQLFLPVRVCRKETKLRKILGAFSGEKNGE